MPMATPLKLITLLFLISSISHLQAQARDSQFFNREVYNTTPKETQRSELDVNTTNQEETNNGYYTDQGYPTKGFDNNVDEFTSEKFPTGEDETVDTPDRLSPRGHKDQQGSTKGLPGKGWKEQYGKSDTRYLDNGRYYFIKEERKVPSGPDAYENYDPEEEQEDDFVP